MKKVLLLLLLCFGVFAHAQYAKTAKNLLVLPPLNTVKPNTFSFHNTTSSFSLYSPFFKTYYNYATVKDTLRINSISHTYNNIYNPVTRIDSFNPTGASNVGSALVLGLINTLFKKD